MAAPKPESPEERAIREARERIEAQTKANPGKSVVENDPEVQQAMARAKFAKEYANKQRQQRHDESKGTSWSDTGTDVVKSAGSGAGRGVAGAPGAPFDIIAMGRLARAYTDAHGWNPFADKRYQTGDTQATKILQDEERRKGDRGRLAPSPETLDRWGGEGWIRTADKLVPGALTYEPKTDAGKAVQTGTEIATGTATGGFAGAGRTGARQIVRGIGRDAVTGAAAGTVAGGINYASGDDPTATTLAAVVTGPLAASYGSKTAERALAEAVRGMTPEERARAAEIFQRAQREGVPLTRTNIADMVTRGRTGGSELQRVVESGNRGPMREFYNSPRDTAFGPITGHGVTEYGNRVLDAIGPQTQQPSTLGPRVARHSQALIDEAENQVNTSTRPQIQSFQNNSLPPGQFDALMQDPAFAQAYKRVTTDPRYHNLITGAPPDSVHIVDMVRADMANEQRNLRTPGATSEGMNERAAGGLEAPVQQAQEAAAEASGPPAQIPGQPPGQRPLETYQQDQAQLREANVDPLDQGPVGQLARAKTTPEAQQVIAPAKPLEGSHVEIGRAVQNIAQRDPQLATEFVRNHLGTTFSATTGQNVPGQPYTAGTKFWRAITGTDQEALNTQAMIEALPGGPARWQVVRDMGEIFDAMGQRQAPGSKTASNIETQEGLKGSGGNWVESLAKFASGGLSTVKEGIEKWRLGSNMDQITALITDPARQADFDRIAALPPNSAARAQAIAAFLINTQPGAYAAPAARQSTDAPENIPSFTVRAPRRDE